MTETETGRKPLTDPEVEQAILGAFMLGADAEAILTIRKLLPTPEYFAGGITRIFYRSLCTMVDRGIPIDVFTLRDQLESEKLLDVVGGVEACATLADTIPTAANAEYHAQMLRELADRRAMVAQGERLVTMARDRQLKVPDIMASVVHELAASTIHVRGRKPKTWTGALFDATERIEHRIKRAAAGSHIEGIPFGLGSIDAILDGSIAGDLTLIAARPSVGKTGIALKIARVASEYFLDESTGEAPPRVVVFVSAEMLKEQLAERLLSGASGLPIRYLIKQNRWRDEHYTALHNAMGELSRLPLRVMDPETHDLTTPGNIRLAIEHFQATEKVQVGLVIFDYIQLLRADGQHENRNRDLGVVVADLKRMGQQLSFPVIALSQLNRASEIQEREPRNSDLRDSGELEQVADKILFLHAEPRNSEWERDKVKAIVSKNRNGETGETLVKYEKWRQIWSEWREDVPQQREAQRSGAAA